MIHTLRGGWNKCGENKFRSCSIFNLTMSTDSVTTQQTDWQTDRISNMIDRSLSTAFRKRISQFIVLALKEVANWNQAIYIFSFSSVN